MPHEDAGLQVENTSSVPPACHKRRLTGAVCRNHRIKRVVPCRCRTGILKNPAKCLWRWEPDRRYNFVNPPAHLCRHIHDWNIIEQRLLDVCKQNMLANVSNSPKGLIYQHVIDHFSLQFYLRKPIEPTYKRFITRFRISAHNLHIETGRRRNIQRINRICQLCNLNEIEDEFHFILKCPLYQTLRTKYIKPYYYRRPSVFKLVQLLSVSNVKDLCNLGKFLYNSDKLRNENL